MRSPGAVALKKTVGSLGPNSYGHRHPRQTVPKERAETLYDDAGSSKKVRVDSACSSHNPTPTKLRISSDVTGGKRLCSGVHNHLFPDKGRFKSAISVIVGRSQAPATSAGTAARWLGRRNARAAPGVGYLDAPCEAVASSVEFPSLTPKPK